MSILISILKSKWIPYAAIITLLCGITYIVVQQEYRLSANDPQYQMAQDAAFALSNGADPKSLVSSSPCELSHCLSPYIIIYDDKENVVATNAFLNGKAPKLPAGVLDYVRKTEKM